MIVRRARPDDLAAMAELGARVQADPELRCAYVSDTAEALASEVDEIDDWPAWCHVAVGDTGAGEGLAGWLLAERDPDMGRTWWWGPFVAESDLDSWNATADALMAVATDEHPDPEQELAVDGRSGRLADFATRWGFTPEESSLMLRLDGPPRHEASASARDDVSVVPLTDIDDALRAAVVALHDATFPGTHTPGHLLVAPDARRPTFVAVEAATALGYVATELQHDGSLYIDYLGVRPDRRGRGLGRLLVAHACGLAADLGATPSHLTVRSSNAAARRLYESVGFVVDAELVPYRSGFSLADHDPGAPSSTPAR